MFNIFISKSCRCCNNIIYFFLQQILRFSCTLALTIRSLAPTEVAKILSFGKIGLGLTITSFLKLKFFIALAQAPIFFR